MPIITSVIEAVSLPDVFVRGLDRLTSRILGISSGEGYVVRLALFGEEPAFGELSRVTVEDIRSACKPTSENPSAASIHNLVDLFKKIGPHTPLCVSCGDMPLSAVAGKVSTLSSGSACPFCKNGQVLLLPMKLKKLSWTDGRLVEPQVSLDLRSHPGERIPLDDDAILSWSGGWIDSRLERAIKHTKVSLYAFLAYANLARKLLKTPHEAVLLLQKPETFGLTTYEKILQVLHQAGAFVSEREITNLPTASTLAFRLGKKSEELERITVSGRSYILEGKIGDGDKSDVFRAMWEHLPTERVIIKVCRAVEDSDLMKRECVILKKLVSDSSKGFEHLSRFLPHLVATGQMKDHDGTQRLATVFRDRNLFDWTLADILTEYPDGVDPQTMVWMWNRLLTILGVVHANGMIHGAVFPDHVLIYPMRHSAILLDWSYAVKFGKKSDPSIQAVSTPNKAYYPEEVFAKESPSPQTDIAMSARSMIAVLGGNPENGDMPRDIPEQIIDILRVHARYDELVDNTISSDAFALQERFGDIVKSLYGPRRYHPFKLPRQER